MRIEQPSGPQKASKKFGAFLFSILILHRLCEVSRLRSSMLKVSGLFYSFNILSETGCIKLQTR
jgi:hypothetical protein